MLLRQAMKPSPHVRLVVLGVSEEDEPEIVALPRPAWRATTCAASRSRTCLCRYTRLLPAAPCVRREGVGNSAPHQTCRHWPHRAVRRPGTGPHFAGDSDPARMLEMASPIEISPLSSSNCRSYRQEPRPQPADQARREHARAGRGTSPRHPATRGPRRERRSWNRAEVQFENRSDGPSTNGTGSPIVMWCFGFTQDYPESGRWCST